MRRFSYKSQRLIARVHFFILGFSLFGYLALVFTLGPGFLSFDVSQKIRALADEIIVVTATVLGPPATPVVTATPSCIDSSNPRITLDWADDTATSTWDIERDSVPLVTGLMSSAYIDTAVSGTNTYSYVVTAYGPMAPGVATSTLVSATAIDCSTILPAATVTLTQLGKYNITPPREIPDHVEESRPRIRGNTNVINAKVVLSVDRPSTIAHIMANENGYFTWKPFQDLYSGDHTLTITVTDPNDLSRTVSMPLKFSIKKALVTNNNEDNTLPVENDNTFYISNTFTEESNSESEKVLLPTGPIDFNLNFLITKVFFQQGDRLNFTVKPERGLFPKDMTFTTSLLNLRGETVFTAPIQTIETATRTDLSWSIRMPLYVIPGKYILSIIGNYHDTSVTREIPIVIKPLPVFQLDENHTITYGEIANTIGWIVFGSFTSLVGFFMFSLREYWLSLHVLRQITGREFTRFGLLALREGVKKR